MKVKISQEHKKQLIEDIKFFFFEERNEEIGELAAEITLDFMMEKIAPVFYNKAIYDSRKLISERMYAIEDDLYALEQPLNFVDRK